MASVAAHACTGEVGVMCGLASVGLCQQKTIKALRCVDPRVQRELLHLHVNNTKVCKGAFATHNHELTTLGA